MSALSIIGIRHHGPGSARGLVRALLAFEPDIVLIEGPADAEALIVAATLPGMVPPVAMLVYNPKNLQAASFFPFAEFSPEWQAIQYGLAQGIPVRFMDLPMSLQFGLREEDAQQVLHFQINTDPADTIDPFKKIAQLAGYSDPERWWDTFVEGPSLQASSEQVVLELMRALRDDKTLPESRETLLREAWMRQTIRTAQKEGFAKIAVVCGAWHGPALADVGQYKASADAALLKGLKKIKTEATWIPWSFDRLAAQSGYAAGILAPAWYRLLFQTTADAPATATIQWLSQVARLLRKEGIDTSSAHIIEAVRLAEGLAVLRNMALPGIEELREAAITVLGEGTEKLLELIDQQLIIGDVLGTVPDKLPMPPLRADFEQQVKSCRLERSTVEKVVQLDLRQEAHLRKSHLLHRLQLLGMQWGKNQPVQEGKQGRFHEDWALKWLPDYEIRLIEAGHWGNTVEDASLRRTRRRARETDSLPVLVELLTVTLKADLTTLLPEVLQQLQQVSALAKDALLLAEAILPLAEVLRYGSARKFDLQAVTLLLEQIIPRMCLQLPVACIGIDEDVAIDVQRKMLAVNRALGILANADYESRWVKTLQMIGDSTASAPLLTGFATRLLFDKNELSAEETGTRMRYHWSRAQAPAEAALWLEGFLHGSGLLLLHHTVLWQTLDTWVDELDEAIFRELLPLLRRTFSRFTGPERVKMLDLARNEPQVGVTLKVGVEDLDLERGEAVLDILRKILS